MNRERRKALDDLAARIEAEVLTPIRDAKEALEGMKGDIEGIRDDEQEYLDNMPEAFQQAERGQNAEAAIAALDDAASNCEEAIDNLNNAQS